MLTTYERIITVEELAETALPDLVSHADTDRYIIVWQQAGDISSRASYPPTPLPGMQPPLPLPTQPS